MARAKQSKSRIMQSAANASRGSTAMATVHTANSRDAYTPDLRGDAGITLGGLLKRARERRGLTLQEIAKETKLPQRHLEALEQDNLAILPTGFYQRAEIRAYARAVGLDQTAVLAKLDAVLKPLQSSGSTPERVRSQKRAIPRPYILITLAIITVAIVMFGRAISQRAPTVPSGGNVPAVTASLPKVESSAPVESPEPAVLRREAQESVARVSTRATGTAAVATEPAPAVSASDKQVPTDKAVTPSSAANVTELVVTTTPAGARVTVNGIAWGISPLTIRHLPPGDKRIRVSKEGYASQERVLRVDENRRQALDFPLETTP